MDNWSHIGDRVVMPAGGTISAGAFVRLSSNTVLAQRDNETVGVFGVAFNSVTVGQDCVVVRRGVVRMTAASGVNFAPGDYVYTTGTEKEVDAGSQNDVAAGVVVDKDPAASSTDVRVQILPNDLANPPTHA